MSSAIGNANGVNLNSPSQQELEKVGGLGQERTERIVQNRPFENWDDLRNVEGFSQRLMDLKHAGARLA